MKNPSRIAATIALIGIVFAAPALSHDYRLGDLHIDHPMAFETPRTAMAGGGYMTITNDGADDDRLIAVRADFPRVMLHTTEETDGVARMIHLDAVEIPAGETVSFAPGGLHVMFMGLDGNPLRAGDSIAATLVFESAGEVDVTFDVVARETESGDGHHHEHENEHDQGHDHDHTTD